MAAAHPDAPPPFDPAAIAKLRTIVTDDDTSWESAWTQHVTPWDKGGPQTLLENLLESDFGKTTLAPKDGQGGKALVPGCGAGYDAVLLADKLGYETVGLDISPTGLEAARGYLSSFPQRVKDKVVFENTDFFKLDVGGYDLVYDYTFFVAIRPTRRVDWGKQMVKLVKPGGYLITLVHPIVAPHTDGPPFYVELDHYKDVLGEGWKNVYDELAEGKRMLVWEKHVLG